MRIELKNFDELKNKLNAITKRTSDKVDLELKRFGQLTVNDAKRLAPVDEGFLRNSITYVPGPLNVEVVVAADYAAYVEFGTKGFAARYVSTLPADWQTFAAKFRGPGGGSFDEFVMRLTRWVIKKKIGATYNVKTRKRDKVGKQSAKTTAEADAYGIALYIMRHGIKPHPFLYPAVEKNRIELIKRLKQVL